MVAGDGETAGSVGVPDGRATLLARAVLDRAAEFRHSDGRVTQLHAALADGAVFAVTGADERTVVAVTSGRPAPGLVFYDLKNCLSRLAEEGLGDAT